MATYFIGESFCEWFECDTCLDAQLFRVQLSEICNKVHQDGNRVRHHFMFIFFTWKHSVHAYQSDVVRQCSFRNTCAFFNCPQNNIVQFFWLQFPHITLSVLPYLQMAVGLCFDYFEYFVERIQMLLIFQCSFC